MKATKPLKILTIDGGGIQAISTLLILDKLLDAIAKNNKVPHTKPRPCDVFDTIAGIGTGGWLAILLGRFHMDITTCLSEWYEITNRILPRSKSEKFRLRLLHHSYFNPERLVEQIDNLTEIYGTGKYLRDTHPGAVRTRHVFVAALKSDADEYNLFRTYAADGAELSAKLLEGPRDSEIFPMSRAFGVTGAAKYLSPPWTEEMSSGRVVFSDSKYPMTHNITKLALDEMWALYGTDVAISVVVNVGPGLPNKSDVKQIASRFSWGLSSPPSSENNTKRSRSLIPPEVEIPKKRTRTDSQPSIKADHSVRFQSNDLHNESLMSKNAFRRNNTFGSVKERAVGKKLYRQESQVEKEIKTKLDNIYVKGSEIYFRLSIDVVPQGMAMNDTKEPGVTSSAAKKYVRRVEVEIEEIATKIRDMASPDPNPERLITPHYGIGVC